MKDFIKWLGVNEKIAKVAVWMLIFMVTLIIINTALESIGFPHYRITYENLKLINANKLIDSLVNIITVVLNFFTTILLVFRIKESKKIFKYSIFYLILNIISTSILGSGLTQIFIALFLIIFSYLYSNKNKKYIIYTVLSIVVNTIIQAITYMYKVKFIDYATLNEITKALLFTDYFIIMAVIILVKEIYIKKRGESNERRTRN